MIKLDSNVMKEWEVLFLITRTSMFVYLFRTITSIGISRSITFDSELKSEVPFRLCLFIFIADIFVQMVTEQQIDEVSKSEYVRDSVKIYLRGNFLGDFFERIGFTLISFKFFRDGLLPM